jgi:purine-binding chemotaxis protein CheW
MASLEKAKSDGKSMEMTTFFVGAALCGIDLLRVEEINRSMKMTAVPQSPDYVLGVINLRGKIVTIIDLGKKLGLPGARITDECRNIIVNSENEPIGLLVDRIADVMTAETGKMMPPPSNVQGVQGVSFKGVYKTDKTLVAILDVDKVLELEEQ